MSVLESYGHSTIGRIFWIPSSQYTTLFCSLLRLSDVLLFHAMEEIHICKLHIVDIFVYSV
jgi:hypothetical protein